MTARSRHLVFAIVAAASVSLSTATVGLAEWQVRTPGGHLISHTDGFKERYGDCLRSDDQAQGEPRIWVSHLVRWRYYEGLVVGESESGYFLFDERSERLTTFDDESSFRRGLKSRNPGAPISPWLTGVDGWREAWFPFVVWGSCQATLARGSANAAGLTAEQCREALAPENLGLLRRTTWGHECRNSDPSKVANRLADFCEALLDDRR